MQNPIKILKNILTIQDDPKIIAKGFALGSFVGMLPIPGFQLMVSLGVATLLKFNKKAACIAVFNTNLATGAFVFSFNYWLGKKLLGLNPSFMIGDKVDYQFISIVFKAGSDVFLSLFVGGIITGLLTAALVYFALLKLLSLRSQKAETQCNASLQTHARKSYATQTGVNCAIFISLAIIFFVEK